MATKPEEQEEQEPRRNRGVNDPLYRERSSSAARQQSAEENYEANRMHSGHIRCGGGWWVRRKKIGGE